MSTEIVSVNVRMTESEREALRDEYSKTYDAHRLSFNAWLVRRLLGEPAATKKA